MKEITINLTDKQYIEYENFLKHSDETVLSSGVYDFLRSKNNQYINCKLNNLSTRYKVYISDLFLIAKNNNIDIYTEDGLCVFKHFLQENPPKPDEWFDDMPF